MDMSQLTSYGYSVEQMKKLGMEMNVVIKMPGKATSNVGTVDGNTVTVDLLDMMATGKSNDIIVSSELSGGGMDMSMIFIIVGVAAIAGVVAFMLMKKKKENHEEVYDGSPISKATEEKVVTEAPVVESDVEEKIEAPTEVVNEEKVEVVTEPKAYCPNCGTPVGSEETCPNCGFTLKK
ncbi:MAG: LPXTG cell wall anchor domain-containing protein [Coprobacillus cateniformis]